MTKKKVAKSKDQTALVEKIAKKLERTISEAVVPDEDYDPEAADTVLRMMRLTSKGGEFSLSDAGSATLPEGVSDVLVVVGCVVSHNEVRRLARDTIVKADKCRVHVDDDGFLVIEDRDGVRKLVVFA